MDKERLFRNLERKYSSKCEVAVNIPLGVDPDAIWEEVLQSRRARGIQLPLYNVTGENYWYLLTNKMISASEVIVEEFAEHDTEQQPHLSSVATIEEIYFTGFMEGAQISIQDAMRFLQSGEEPSNVEELILLNNRQAAGFAAENMYHAIDGNYLHNLAYFLTEGLDNGSGDFRISDSIDIPSMQGEVVRLPPANEIPSMVNHFAAFLADTKTHPLIKAAAAQAWVLAVRPFPEGNERLARLLSNVILIRAGYSFFGEVSISSVIAKSSYEYFRAIANILRTENGADLTYFLEYYLVALSAAVNELKARRERQDDDMIEEEHRMAAMPLSQLQDKEQKPYAVENDRISDWKKAPRRTHKELVLLIEKALCDMQNQGLDQFTVLDVAAQTGINKKQISKLLLPYEAAQRIIAVRKSKAGNIYTFNHAYCPSDESGASSAPAEDYAFDHNTMEALISALKLRVSTGNESASMVAAKLLDYIEQGKYQHH